MDNSDRSTPSTRVVYNLRTRCARTGPADVPAGVPSPRREKTVAGADRTAGNVDGKAMRTDLERAVTSPASSAVGN